MTDTTQHRIQSFAFVIAVVVSVCFSICFVISGSAKPGQSCEIELDAKINPNNAPSASLARLPGIGIVRDGEIKMAKRSGKIKELKVSIKGKRDLGNAKLGIGHSRWATHGAPTDINAHPHADCSGSIALVHNGIIENFSEIKEKLIGKGHRFKSETDTEVIVHLIEEYYRGDLEKAVLKALKYLKEIGRASCRERV